MHILRSIVLPLKYQSTKKSTGIRTAKTSELSEHLLSPTLIPIVFETRLYALPGHVAFFNIDMFNSCSTVLKCNSLHTKPYRSCPFGVHKGFCCSRRAVSEQAGIWIRSAGAVLVLSSSQN